MILLPPRFRSRQRGYISPGMIGAIAGRRRGGGGGGGGGGGPETDPNFASVVALLHFDDFGSPQFVTDKAPGSPTRIWTLNGNAQCAADQAMFGAGSLKLDGTGDYLLSASHPDFGFGAGDYTVEGWFRFNTNAIQMLFDFGSTAARADAHVLYCRSGGGLTIFNNNINVISGGIPSTGAWHHIAYARSGTATKLFLDGTQTGSTWTAGTNFAQNALHIGIDYTPANGLNGWIDEVRITKGVARYTGNFTPPSAAFPDS